MADVHLRRSVRFAKRAAKRLVVKQRIVPKPVRSARLVNNAPLDDASKGSRISTVAHQRDDANESRASILYAAQLFEQPVVIEVCGTDSRPAAERIDFDPRIVD